MLFILFASILVNYLFSYFIMKYKTWRKIYLIIPILINIGLLLYYKYSNFFLSNICTVFHVDYAMKELLVPVGISFFTFQQIVYLVAVYRGEIKKNSFLDYAVFIAYYPKILMGPLMDPVDFISQVNDVEKKYVDWDNVADGIKLFSFGLFKKVMIADILAKAVSWGFKSVANASSMDMILVMLFYTFQIYFDFSGYCDMATGVSLMMNITLPINFDSPYKALSIRDFWKSWHISLTGFFTKYIYIPLGGNRKGIIFTCLNTLLVFLISGIWHGANWTFILWGVLHGFLSIFDRIFDKYEKRIFEAARWICTFLVINILWLLFRSDTVQQWLDILQKIVRLENLNISEGLINSFILTESGFISSLIGNITLYRFWILFYLLFCFVLCLCFENNYRNRRKRNWATMAVSAAAFIWSVISLSSETVFLYFNF